MSTRKKILSALVLLLFISFLFSCNQKSIKKDAIILSDERLGILKIYSYDGKEDTKYGLVNLGHSFLNFINESEQIIQIGYYNVQPLESITFGTWGMSSHSGIWYNLESAYIHNLSRYSNRVSIQKSITSLSEINALNEFIYENDYWNPFYNCTSFAIRLWNYLAKPNEVLEKGLYYRPAKLTREITSYNNYKRADPIIYNDNVGYFQAENFIKHEVVYA